MKSREKLLGILTDPSRTFKERLFVLMTIIALSSVFVAFIGDVFTGENVIESVVLGVLLFISFIGATIAVHKGWIDQAALLIAFGVVFIALPVTFFFGGGLTGGGILWIVFSYLYVGLILHGRSRQVTLAVLTVMTFAEFAISYYHPHLIPEHSREMWYVDMGISVILVGFVVYIFVRFQNHLYDLEAKRASDQAKEIEELSRAQNRFFSSMSHEIRTPINTIIGLNEMILRENASDEINENAANIQVASKMLLNVINDILDMSKFESGQMELAPTEYHTGDMLSDVVSMLWIRAKEKNLEFTVDVSPELPSKLLGDDVRIKQILINVINNAIKYTNEGYVKLQIQCERRDNAIANVIYTISDTGIGIKKESLPYLFSAFKRVDEEKNKYIEGTGLGLSIVKQFVDLMGGKITVNSIYTKGSTFIIEIPQKIVDDSHVGEVRLGESHTKNIEQHVTAFEAPKAKVLVVDDTAANLLVVQKLLRATKVRLDSVSSGKDALQKTFDTHYDVIFMDHMMPEMDGIECLQKIRKQDGGRCRESKVVALTANAGSDNERIYEREGFDGYLVKPVTGKDLENELYRLLPRDLVIVTGTAEKLAKESIAWIRDHRKKSNVKITTESVADIPTELLEKYDISCISHMVKTPKGLFRDGTEIETRGLLAYMDEESGNVETSIPDVSEHELFFAQQLEKANNIIHIAISSKVVHSSFHPANEAAVNFDNVFVVDTGHLSGGQGLMAIEAARMAAKGADKEEILDRLEEMKYYVRTGFIVDTLDYLAGSGHISKRMARISGAFMVHPLISLINGRMVVSRIFMGSKERAYERYIASTFRVSRRIDRRLLLIVYAGMTEKELERIKKLVEKRISFDKIYFQETSAAIAVNCGPGTFGLLFSTEF